MTREKTMTLQGKLNIIRLIIWACVAADALWAIALVYPPLYELLTNRVLGPSLPGLRPVMGLGASLMAGWTVLLIWAAQEPIQRRAVILIAAIPAVLGIFGVILFGVINGGAALWLLFKVAFLEVALLWAYYLACSISEGGHTDENHS